MLFQPAYQGHQEIGQDQADDKRKQEAPDQVYQPDKEGDTQHQGYEPPVLMKETSQETTRSNIISLTGRGKRDPQKYIEGGRG